MSILVTQSLSTRRVLISRSVTSRLVKRQERRRELQRKSLHDWTVGVCDMSIFHRSPRELCLTSGPGTWWTRDVPATREENREK